MKRAILIISLIAYCKRSEIIPSHDTTFILVNESIANHPNHYPAAADSTGRPSGWRVAEH